MGAVFDVPAQYMLRKKQRPGLYCYAADNTLLLYFVLLLHCHLSAHFLKELRCCCLILGLNHLIEKVDWLEECAELPGQTYDDYD